MKKLILLLSLVPLVSFGQTAKSRATLYTEIDTQFASGTAITAATLRSTMKNVVASARNDLTDGTSITATQISDSTAAGRTLLTALSSSVQRSALGLVINTDVQGFDADLSTYASITPSANIQSFLGAADYAAMRTQLGLVIGTNVQAYDADLTTYAGITPSANVQTLLGAADFAAFRTSLGLVVGTNVQAYDADLDTWATITPGTGVGTFLATPSGANLAAALTTALPVSKGGTGATTLTANNVILGNGTSAVAFVAPGANGNVLTSNGTTWTSAAPSGGSGTGDVSAASNFGTDNVLIRSDGTTKGVQATGITVDDSNNITGVTGITTTSLTFTNITGTVPVANGGTGGTDAATARTNLGLAIGTNVQAYDADLTTYAGITPSANVQTFLGAANYAAMKTQLALTIGTDVQAYDADLTTWAGVTPGTGVGTFLATPSSANLRAALTDESGTGAALFAGGNIGSGTATTPSTGDNSTSIATTAFVQNTIQATFDGTLAAPNTTTPLSPTWTSETRIIHVGATGTVNLPAAAGYTGRALMLVFMGSYVVTVDPNGSEIIYRAGTAQTGGVSTTVTGTLGQQAVFYSDGTSWMTVGTNATLAAGS